ncbi:hypothetical protein [Nocardia huaxiensis]|uniref:hypothetical protein n=1 Tax=Nocardia huaxiensis TaxID=2755382 RepID=UPI001E5294BF|nr:hypothetical protein [Nocardia huaxiensis]UFS94794.1 hypothetical protein LPY97_29280 [Nocardia huaxiensis]
MWLATRIAEAGISKLVDRGIDSVSGGGLDARLASASNDGAQRIIVQRHNLVGGARPTSDLDIDVRRPAFARPVGHEPVFLTLQQFTDRSGGIVFPMILGETAHMTVPRDDYFIAALVVQLPEQRDELPTLRAVGQARHFVAGNDTTRIEIQVERATIDHLLQLGLFHNNQSVFNLPPPPPRSNAAPGQCNSSTSTVPGQPNSSTTTGSAQADPWNGCRVRLPSGRRCGRLLKDGRGILCDQHSQALEFGHRLTDHLTGLRIVDPPWK